ncbi:hypothetical protein OC25_16320 [Pedobacter kyungheensis]|uniref:MepB family protein n=1 Tax=Pedobacter kyungheensis TaxID=1069985 RepID=A0A0C1DFB0_9SPHI|nr:MepB family protein [Pedobacter kyungheensis]KIA92605.1 hypothetical protein OC25_16320 [Pedobacter kyungheensis]
MSESTTVLPQNLADIPPVLLAAIKNCYHPSGYQIKNYQKEPESQEYYAATFELNELKIKHRQAKITPAKTGQFVTIWKRSEKGITEPFDASDDFDLLIISVCNGELQGQFIFPKKVLIAQKIVTQDKNTGKRGIRVYPPWDMVSSKQALKSQQWQTSYFLFVSNQHPLAISSAKKLLIP